MVVKQDASNNIYFIGDFKGTVDFDPSSAVFNLSSVGQTMFICKLTETGNFIWAKSLELSSTPGDLILSRGLDLDNNGNVFITGIIKGTVDFDPSSAIYNLSSVGYRDFFTAKYDSTGSFVWANVFNAPAGKMTESFDIATDKKGNVFVTGRFRDSVDFDAGVGVNRLVALSPSGAYDIFVAKYDNAGNYIGAKQFGGGNFGQGNALAIDNLGNVLITGTFSHTFDFDPDPISTYNLTVNFGEATFISKLDSNGNFVWARDVQNPYFIPAGNDGKDIAVDNEGNAYVTGSFRGTTNFDRLVSNDSLVSIGSRNIYVQKVSAAGQHIWAKLLGGTEISEGYSLAIADEGGVYVSGYIYGTVDFDPSPNTAMLTSNGNADAFITKMDNNGNYVWAKNFGGAEDDGIQSIFLGDNNSIYSTGFFKATCDFDPDAGVFNLSAVTDWDAFVHKMKNGSVGLNDKELENIVLYPNPTNGRFSVDLDKNYTDVKLVISDMLGNKIIENNYSSISKIDLNIEKTDGLYFVELILPKGQSVNFKLLKK